MAHRSFQDQSGRVWEVWEVRPTMAERRAAKQPQAFPGERRRHSEVRAPLPSDLRNGWLAFECRAERRWIAPTPEAWEGLADSQLTELLDRATVRPKPRRLIE